MMRRFASATALLLALAAPLDAARAQPCGPDALGTSRVLSVGAAGGLETGLKSYPRALPLADREIVLTFDDGPESGATDRVLDALKQECVRATFFLIGRNAAEHPALVRRITAEGHLAAHHSWSHPSATLRRMSEEAARADIEHGFAAVEAAAGQAYSGAPRTPFFRFPGFADTAALNVWLASRDIAVFGADVWASDWTDMTPEAQLALLMSRIEAAGRGVVLLHDPRAQTVRMLPAFLRRLKERGFRIVHLQPGAGRTETVAAGPRWRSEVEAILARLGLPKR